MAGEINYDSIFGVDTSPDPAAEDSVGSEAGGAPTGSAEGSNDGQYTEVPGEETQAASEGEQDQDNGPDAAGEGGNGNSAGNDDLEERQKAFRERALKEARERAQAESGARLDADIKALGLVDPYTKKPIETKAEYDAYRERVNAGKRDKLLKKLGMTEQEFTEFAREQPEIRQQLEAAQNARREAERAAVADQMRQIHEMDPEINDIRDFAKMPNYVEFYRLVKYNKLSFVQAYQLCNMDKLRAKAAGASRQAALNVQSKQHLERTNSRGKGNEVVVPPEVREYYKALNPRATDAEIRADYAKYAAQNLKGV